MHRPRTWARNLEDYVCSIDKRNIQSAKLIIQRNLETGRHNWQDSSTKITIYARNSREAYTWWSDKCRSPCTRQAYPWYLRRYASLNARKQARTFYFGMCKLISHKCAGVRACPLMCSNLALVWANRVFVYSCAGRKCSCLPLSCFHECQLVMALLLSLYLAWISSILLLPELAMQLLLYPLISNSVNKYQALGSSALQKSGWSKEAAGVWHPRKPVT